MLRIITQPVKAARMRIAGFLVSMSRFYRVTHLVGSLLMFALSGWMCLLTKDLLQLRNDAQAAGCDTFSASTIIGYASCGLVFALAAGMFVTVAMPRIKIKG